MSECSDDEKEIMALPTLQSPYILNYSSQGEMRFSANVRHVLESYVISRGILTGILFKCGGTLLYSDEVRILLLRFFGCFICTICRWHTWWWFVAEMILWQNFFQTSLPTPPSPPTISCTQTTMLPVHTLPYRSTTLRKQARKRYGTTQC